MACTFLVLQHVDCEPPAAYGEELALRGAAVHPVVLDAGEPPPRDCSGFAGIISMGGPMAAYETSRYPWLEQERGLLRAAVDADMPVWGVCLGAQLIAACMGADVRAGRAPEIGVQDLTLSEPAASDPVFARAPSSFPALQWHSDTYDLPAGATRLASSSAYVEQAFRVRNAYGLQFHLEVGVDLLERWALLPAYARSLEQALGPGGLERLLSDWRPIAPRARALARTLFAAWLEEIVGLPALRAGAAA